MARDISCMNYNKFWLEMDVLYPSPRKVGGYEQWLNYNAYKI